MIWFILLTSYLFFTKKQIFDKTNSNTYSNLSNNIKIIKKYNTTCDEYVGFDNRYSNQSKLNLTTVSIIQYNLKKQQLLNILQDPTISLYTKLRIIDTTNDIIPYDICMNKFMDEF